jgi:hypothetical protein
MNESDKNTKKKFRVVKTIKKVKKFSFDEGLIFLGTSLQN